MLKSRFLWQIWAVLGATLVISTLVFSFVILDQVERAAYLRVERGMQSQALELTASLVPILEGDQPVEQTEVMRLTPGILARITLVAADGRVLADNRQSATRMDNHGNREEILQVASGAAAFGKAQRYSDTLGQNMLYLAVRLGAASGKQGYLRLAHPVTSIEEQMAILNTRIIYAAIGTGLLFLIFGYGLAYGVTNPIAKITDMARLVAKGAYGLKLPEDRQDEIGQMAVVINELALGARQRIDELTDNRNQLAAVLAGLTEGVIAFNSERQLLHINAAALKMLGVGGEVPPDFLETSAPREVKRVVETSLSEGISFSSTLVIAARIFECSTAIMQDATGEDAGGLLVLEDITERRRLEQVRSDFVANASHELKTPISAIRGLVETIIDDPKMPADTAAKFVERIRNQAIRLDRIVKDLLQLSRADASEGKQLFTRVDLAAIVKQVHEAKKEDADDAGVKLELAVKSAPLEVEGEPEGLHQLITNLVDNAIKYNEAGGRVQLRLITVGQAAQIEVEDDGVGIAKDEVERIFERFYRVDRAHSHENSSTGLGLSIVKHIAQAHRGRVWVESQLEKGSIFRVRLPLATSATGP